MNKRCPQFLQGTTVFYTLEKIETMVIQNWVARWGGGGGGGEDNKVYYGQCENGEFPGPHKLVNFHHYKWR